MSDPLTGEGLAQAQTLDPELRRRLEESQQLLGEPRPPMPGTSAPPQLPEQQVQPPEDFVPPTPSPHPPAQPDPDLLVRGEKGLLETFLNQFMGTTVDDPLPWTRLGTTVGGSVAGTVLGAQVPGPPVARAAGALGGTIAGGVVGAVAPETAMELMEKAGLVEQGFREKTGLSDEELAAVAEGEAVVQVGTLGAVSGARAVTRPFIRSMTGLKVRGARERLETATRYHIATAPVQVGTHRIPRMFVSVFGNFPFIAGPMRRNMQTTMRQIGEAWDNLPRAIAPLATFDELGQRIFSEARDVARGLSDEFLEAREAVINLAARNDVRVRPVITSNLLNPDAARHSRSVMNDILREVPRRHDGSLNFGGLNRDKRVVARFVINQLAPTLSRQGARVDVPIREYDTLLQHVRDKIAEVAKLGYAEGVQRLSRIESAMATDAMRNSLGQRAPEFVAEMQRLDHEFARRASELFANASARKLGIRMSDETRGVTRIQVGQGDVDSLADFVLSTNNPNVVRELGRITSRDTMRDIASTSLRRAIDDSIEEIAPGAGSTLNADKLARQLGLDAPTSRRYRKTAALLERAGGLSIENVGELVDLTRTVAGGTIPDVSMFLARGTILGGARTLVNRILPGALLGAGAATEVALTGGMFASFMFILGSRGFGKAITDPRTAPALRRAIVPEARMAAKRSAYLRAAGLVLGELADQGDMSQEEATNRVELLRGTYDEMQQRVRETQNAQ